MRSPKLPAANDSALRAPPMGFELLIGLTLNPSTSVAAGKPDVYVYMNIYIYIHIDLYILPANRRRRALLLLPVWPLSPPLLSHQPLWSAPTALRCEGTPASGCAASGAEERSVGRSERDGHLGKQGRGNNGGVVSQ